jgi:CBS domain-containing protein
MKIERLMTRDVRTVAPDLPLREVAATLTECRISGVPVVDREGAVIGVVSETDIVRKEQGGGGLPHSGLLGRLRDRDADDPVVSARTAGEAMTSPALTIAPDQSVSEAARLMTEHKVNRLPVIGDEGLVGIVTRADLVRAFHRSDREISDEIVGDVIIHTLWIDRSQVTVSVEDGVVSLGGTVDTKTQAELIMLYLSRVPGVVEVHSDLGWDYDDQASRRSIEPRPLV